MCYIFYGKWTQDVVNSGQKWTWDVVSSDWMHPVNLSHACSSTAAHIHHVLFLLVSYKCLLFKNIFNQPVLKVSNS